MDLIIFIKLEKFLQRHFAAYRRKYLTIWNTFIVASLSRTLYIKFSHRRHYDFTYA